MLNEFGKICRKLRIDHDELLMDMATCLGVSPAFLSKVENGKAKPPIIWKDAINKHYELDKVTYDELCKSIDDARSINTLKIQNVKESDNDLMLAFARRIGTLTESEKEILRKKFDL